MGGLTMLFVAVHYFLDVMYKRVYLSQDLWHSHRDEGPGSSAHRPTGEAHGGTSCTSCSPTAPVYVGPSFGMHPNSLLPIVSSSKPPLSSLPPLKNPRFLGRNIKRFLKNLLHVTGLLPLPLTTTALSIHHLTVFCLYQAPWLCMLVVILLSDCEYFK